MKYKLIAELAEYQFLQGELEYVAGLTKNSLNANSNYEHNILEVFVALRTAAMMQGSEDAIQKIDEYCLSASSEEKVELLKLKAEILFLDANPHAAKKVFQDDILPLIPEDANDLRFVVADNLNLVSAHTFDPSHVRDFYALVDEHRKYNIKIYDTEEAIVADENASEGKHYQALPEYWGILVRSFRSGYWRGYWWASKRMAKECLALELPHEAALHAMVAMEDKQISIITNFLLHKKNPELVSRTVSVLLSSAHLAKHAAFAASFLSKISKIVQDSDISRIGEWLLKCAVRIDPGPFSPSLPESAWKALESIAPRLSQQLCDEVITVARQHLAWKKPVTMRKSIIMAVAGCVKTASADTISSLHSDCINLITTWKCDFDYPESLELFNRVYIRVDDETKKIMAEAVFPNRNYTPDPRKLILATSLGIALGNESEWSQYAQVTTDIIKRQVQNIDTSEKPGVSPGSYGTSMGPHKPGEKRVVVQMDSGIYLRALYGHHNKISQEAIVTLIEAVLKMLADPDNSFNNKILLVEAIGELAEAIPQGISSNVQSCLEPLYEGIIVEPRIGMTHAEATSPLNAFKMSSGDPKRLRGEALIAGAKLLNAQQTRMDEKFKHCLLSAITSNDEVLKRTGLKAARYLSVLSPDLVAALIMGTRDTDAGAACFAFAALIGRDSYDYDDSLWPLLIMSLNMALVSDEVNLRGIAAEVVSKLLNSENQEKYKTELETLQSLAFEDICYSVRTKASMYNK